MSFQYPSDWIAKVEAPLTSLAEKPLTLFFFLLSINTIVQPYAGITHDTRLYSGQVLNQVEAGATRMIFSSAMVPRISTPCFLRSRRRWSK